MNSPRIELNEDTHEYRVDGVLKRSVTQTLTDVGIIDSRWFDGQSRIRGDYVHRATALHDLKKLKLESLDPTIRPYFDAYVKFRQESGFKPALIEEKLFWKEMDICGTLDRTGALNGRQGILDIKTGHCPLWVRYQLAAYQAAYKSMTGIFLPARWALELRANETYGLYEFNDFRDVDKFRACVEVSRMRGF
jgi:hypothetical protein